MIWSLQSLIVVAIGSPTIIDLSSTASTPWNSGLVQSCDLTQLSVTGEGKRNENHVMWHQKQTDINGHSNSITRTQGEGGWLSSPHVNVSQHLFQEAMEDSKSVPPWPVLVGYSTPLSSKSKNDPIPDPSDKGRKYEVPTSYRLFGFDLVNQSTSSSPIEKVSAQPISVSSGATDGRVLAALPAVDSDRKHEVSKEKKPEQLHISSKEIQSKHSSTSTRSRTKVLKIRASCLIKTCFALFSWFLKEVFCVVLNLPIGSTAGDCCWSGRGLDLD